MEKYQFHPGAYEAINISGLRLVEKLEEAQPTNNPSSNFPSEIPVGATITDKDVIGDIQFGEINQSNQYVAKYFKLNEKMFGLKDEGYQDLRRLVDQLLKTQWVKEKLGASYVEQQLFKWCEEYFKQKTTLKLSDYISENAAQVVKPFQSWVPVAFLQVEGELEFGPVKICPITAKMIDEKEKRWLEMHPKQSEQTRQFIKELRKDMQGLGAIVVDIEAEQGHASDQALEVAEIAIGLIRLHSPAAYIATEISACAVLGAESAPTATVLSYSGMDSFRFNKTVLPPMSRNWQISKAAWKHVREKDLPYLTDLISEFGLTEFQSSLRLAVLTYSKGLTMREPNDKLVYVLSALESLLLRDTSEPIQQNLGERIAFLIGLNPDERLEIVRNVRSIYAMRSKYIHHRVSVTDEAEIANFILTARVFFGAAITNSRNFKSKRDFIEAIERRKFGG